MNQEDREQQELAARSMYYREVIRGYSMMTDVFARNVLKDRECATQVLQIILEKPDLQVTEVHVQGDYKNLQGRSSILDCVAIDSSGRIHDIEVEHEGRGFPPKRARYYSGLLDMNTLRENEDYERLREAYVICITDRDILCRNLPVYHIQRTVIETGEIFEDASQIIYVNAGIQEDTALGRLVHDFHCTDAADIHNPILRKKVNALKNTPEGVEEMCAELREIEEYGVKKGVKKGKMQQAREGVLRMHAKGYSTEEIAEIQNVSMEEVEKWIAEDAIPA